MPVGPAADLPAAGPTAPAPGLGRERWAVGPLLRFTSAPLEACFQQEQGSRQGEVDLCWSGLACMPSVLWELRQRRPLPFTALGLAVLLLPLWAAWLRLRAPGRCTLRQAALVAQMACWAAFWAASQQASARLPLRAAPAQCSAAAPWDMGGALPLLVLLLRMSLPAAAAGQAAAAAAVVVAGGAACRHALAACPHNRELFVRAAVQLDAWAAAAVAACGLLSLGVAYARERRQRREFAARHGQRQAELELMWRRVPAWRSVLQFALAACVLWLPISAAWLRP
ncbi:hypothetical protein ABPG75_004550 [Micractinium tetrahymenae]